MRYLFPFVIAACIFLTAVTAQATDPFVVGMPRLAEGHSQLLDVERFLIEAYSRIGKEVQFIYLPAMREIDQACAHNIDASCGRTKRAVEGHPNVTLVETPIIKTSVVAYSVSPKLEINAWEDLAALRVGILRGDLTSAQSLKKVHIRAREFNVLELGFTALKKGRLDVFVTHPTLVALGHLDYAVRSLHSSPALYTGHFYHALSTLHADIAAPLSDAFSDMLKDGTTERILESLSQYLPTLEPHSD